VENDMFRSIFRCQPGAGEQLKYKLASLRRGGYESADFVAYRLYK